MQCREMQCRQGQRMDMTMTCRVGAKKGRSRKTKVLPLRATMKNISAEGCAVRSPRLAYARNDKVVLCIDGITQIRAEVSWKREGKDLGMHFAKPLEPAVIDRIARAAQAESIRGVKARKAVSLASMARRAAC